MGKPKNKKPLEFIKSCIRRRSILWTYHVNMRLKERFISREAVLFSIDTYEIIESYPDDKYFPSFLIWAQYEKAIMHIHIAADFENETAIIITAYKPTEEKWAKGFKQRRQS
jgi:hypothetical protein